MSYSIREAGAEQQQAIVAAINRKDSEALFKLAQIVKEQGDDEQAEAIAKVAEETEDEDAETYAAEREAERYEAYRDELREEGY